MFIWNIVSERAWICVLARVAVWGWSGMAEEAQKHASDSLFIVVAGFEVLICIFFGSCSLSFNWRHDMTGRWLISVTAGSGSQVDVYDVRWYDWADPNLNHAGLVFTEEGAWKRQRINARMWIRACSLCLYKWTDFILCLIQYRVDVRISQQP